MLIKNIVILFLTTTLLSQNITNAFYAIDQHADKAPESLKKSIPLLVRYLVLPAKNDTEKVRAIFRWISQNVDYDAKAFFEGRQITDEPLQVIKRGKAVCSGYARLLQNMCREAGIECVIIPGWSKGYGQQLSESPNHAWNAVKINGTWYLLDVTWGSGYINEQRTFTKSFQEHYFFTDPELMIYDHLPEDNKWQRLASPVSRADFEQLILLRPDFFKTGLGLLSHKDAQIYVKDELMVKLTAPVNTFVNAELIHQDSVLADHFVFSQRMENEYHINVHFPDEGDYTLRIYSKEGNDQKIYQWACDYYIHVLKNKNSHPFSKQFSSFYDLESYLYYPLDLILSSKTNQSFKIQVKGALQVSMLFGEDKVIPLSKTGDIYSLNVIPASGPLRIMAKTDTTNQYQFLLEYQVR
jgi:Transglutaminase-like superfamily